MNRIRALVSKKKKRFQEDGFDLDLSYITPRIIAMGFPSAGTEAAYRNPMSEVQRFFVKRHQQNYKVYNLCSERGYDNLDFPHVARFPFDDHNPCRLDMIEIFCQDADKFLAEDERNVIAIHCKAGKGRTGLIICAYLIHSGICANSQEALDYFARERTFDGKGVTIPSQIRFVHYFGELCSQKPNIPKEKTFKLDHIRLVTVPEFDAAIFGGGCDPYVIISILFPQEDETSKSISVYNMLNDPNKDIKKFTSDKDFCDLDFCRQSILLKGNVKISIRDLDNGGMSDAMCHFWFNTRYINGSTLILEKKNVDKANKDKHCRNFSKDFRIELYFTEVQNRSYEFLYNNFSEDIYQFSDEEDEDEYEEDFNKTRSARYELEHTEDNNSDNSKVISFENPFLGSLDENSI